MEFVDSICFALWCTIEIQTSATFPPHLLIFRLDFLFPRIKSQLATWKHVWTPRSHTNIIFSFYFLVYRITYLPRNSISTYDSCQTVFFFVCNLLFDICANVFINFKKLHFIGKSDFNDDWAEKPTLFLCYWVLCIGAIQLAYARILRIKMHWISYDKLRNRSSIKKIDWNDD